MNFLDQQKELAAQLGLDHTATDDSVLIKRWLNTSQKMIAEADDWPWLRASKPLIIQTVSDVTTGTATVALAGTTVTLSSAPASSMTGRYIQFATSNDWYEITAHTAGETTLTIDPAALAAESATAYTIRKFYYSTSSTVDKILQIKQSVTPYQLEEIGKEEFDRRKPDPDSTGTPRAYIMAGNDSNKYLQFCLYPTPDDEINLHIDYNQILTDLSADDDVSKIPEKWHRSVMIEGGKWQGYDFLDDSRATESKKLFFSMIDEMKAQAETSKTISRVLQPVEAQIESNQVEMPFPDDYPNV